MRALAALQARIVAASRFGIPAVAHEECLTGFAAWTATIYPTPLAWGASFDPALVRDMAGAFGATMHAVGIHQGLAPVLDVTRDPRWGRTEETIGEDPYLVGTIGTGYVRGLQSAGRAGHAEALRRVLRLPRGAQHGAGLDGPAGVRRRHPAAVRDGDPARRRPLRDAVLHRHRRRARERRPAAARARCCATTLGFDGLVVSDYYAVSFLELQHAIAGSPAGAAALALTAGIDVELPSVRCYGEPLRSAAARRRRHRRRSSTGPSPGCSGRSSSSACSIPAGPRVPGCRDGPDGDAQPTRSDPPASRALARRLAEESVVLLANGGALPLAKTARVAVVGPLADDPLAFFGCYSMPRHLGTHAPTAAGVARSPPCSTRCARSCPTCGTRAAATSAARTGRVSPRQSPRPVLPN